MYSWTTLILTKSHKQNYTIVDAAAQEWSTRERTAAIGWGMYCNNSNNLVENTLLQSIMFVHKQREIYFSNILISKNVFKTYSIVFVMCKRDLEKRRYSAKETYNFKEPTNTEYRYRVSKMHKMQHVTIMFGKNRVGTG